MYEVNVGYSEEFTHILSSFATYGQRVLYFSTKFCFLPTIFRWSKIEGAKNLIFRLIHQKSIHGGYTKWHKKFSLWRPCCVTQTSL